MYLHLGQSVVVPFRDVIGIFDLDTTTDSRAERINPLPTSVRSAFMRFANTPRRFYNV